MNTQTAVVYHKRRLCIGRKCTTLDCRSEALFDKSQFLSTVLGVQVLVSIPDPRIISSGPYDGIASSPHELLNVEGLQFLNVLV